MSDTPSPPWPGSAKDRVRLILFNGNHGAEGRLMAGWAGEPNPIEWTAVELMDRTAGGGTSLLASVARGATVLCRNAGPETARQVLARLLHVEPDVALAFDPGHVSIMDVDRNGAAIRRWNVLPDSL